MNTNSREWPQTTDSDLTLTSTTLLSKHGKESISSAASHPKNGDQGWKHRDRSTSLTSEWLWNMPQQGEAHGSLKAAFAHCKPFRKQDWNQWVTYTRPTLKTSSTLRRGWSHQIPHTNIIMTSLGIGMPDSQMKINKNNSFSRMLPWGSRQGKDVDT